MNEVYTSYFIAIPIPNEFIEQFKNLIDELKAHSSDIQTVNPSTSHFTLYYLTKETENDLDYVNKCIVEHAYLLKNSRVEIGGFNFFGKDQPRVFFLDVKYPKELEQFNQTLANSLSKYAAAENNLGFHPHVTVASVKDPNTKKFFQAKRDSIEHKFNQINWTFPLREIVLYGANSGVKPEIQVPLKKITI